MQLPVPPPGTLVHAPGGETIVYVGVEFTATQAEVDALALQLRDTQRIVIVGDMWRSAKIWKNALHSSWSAANKAARDAAKPPKPVKYPTPRCGRPRKDGEPCTLPAGWGADPGEAHCMHHGGSRAQQEAALKHAHQQAALFAKISRTGRTRPLTLPEQITALTALRDVVAHQQSTQGRRKS